MFWILCLVGIRQPLLRANWAIILVVVEVEVQVRVVGRVNWVPVREAHPVCKAAGMTALDSSAVSPLSAFFGEGAGMEANGESDAPRLPSSPVVSLDHRNSVPSATAAKDNNKYVIDRMRLSNTRSIMPLRQSAHLHAHLRCHLTNALGWKTIT